MVLAIKVAHWGWWGWGGEERGMIQLPWSLGRDLLETLAIPGPDPVSLRSPCCAFCLGC